MKLNINDKIKVKESVEAYYSGYAGSPKCFLTTDIIGIIKAINVPSVRNKNGKVFNCVDFLSPVDNKVHRASVFSKNIIKII